MMTRIPSETTGDLARFIAALQSAIADPARPALSEEILIDEPLARYTLARLGGPADVLVRVTRSDKHLLDTVRLCREYGIPFRMIGGGANVLFSDAGFRGVIIVNAIKSAQISRETGIVDVSAGYTLSALTRETVEMGLAGLEWAISVPGTVGGAVVNNAGAHGSDVATNLVSAVIYTEHVETWPVARLEYEYRESALKRARFPFVVLRGVFRLSTGNDPDTVRFKVDEFVAHRRRTQPPGASLGSMFKNPKSEYAGRLIEAAGLKGTQVGGVVISPIHGNFMINVGGGTARDYWELIGLTRAKVRAETGITLELEIELIGEEP